MLNYWRWQARLRKKLILAAFMLCCFPLLATATPREDFKQAWQAAGRGDHTSMRNAMPGLQDYLLYPYLRYENFRNRRSVVAAEDMQAFLSGHTDWAFTSGLRTAWLRTLGRLQRWDDLLAYAAGSTDTEVRCHQASAKALRGKTENLAAEIKPLWLLGRSQHKACDPAFAWLRRNGHLPASWVWQRLQLAVAQGNFSLAEYLSRSLSARDQRRFQQWRRVLSNPSGHLSSVRQWPDDALSWRMLAITLQQQTRRDAAVAGRLWDRLETVFSWQDDERQGLLYDIGLYSAVALEADALQRIDRVPAAYVDDRLLQWRLRAALSQDSWDQVMGSVARMSDEQRQQPRWRYWRARALEQLGQPGEAGQVYADLARQASYYGFLAADRLQQPYSLCPLDIPLEQQRLQRLRSQDNVARALELRQVDMHSFANGEWRIASRGWDEQDLRHAAAIATDERWPFQAIAMLGNSGDWRAYEWRFPLHYQQAVAAAADAKQLDPAWVLGLIRSESAMNPNARSSANARGLMQVTPGTAKQLSRRHGFGYRHPRQLFDVDLNLAMGTAFLRELGERFQHNPILIAGAYNAGPHVVDRWLRERPPKSPDVWVELLPYYETRDYIPRVLTFSTIYDWRLQRPVQRLSSRMPRVNSAPGMVQTGLGQNEAEQTTQIICGTDNS